MFLVSCNCCFIPWCTDDGLFELLGGQQGRSGVPSVAAYEVPSIPLLKLQKSTWHTECDPPVSAAIH